MNIPIQALQDKISLDDLLAINQPIAQARGMPNQSYTDQEFFEFERDNILSKNWAAIAFADGIENAMVRPIDFMGLPILISKTKEGVVKVFHNVCSHRGMKLVEKTRKTNGLIVCPYHSWTYAVDGELKATPNIGGMGTHKVAGFSCADKGLKEIRSYTWMGIVFINLEGNAADFEIDAAVEIKRAKDLMGDSGENLLRTPQEYGELSLELECNWKLAIENFLEAYHLPTIHPGLNVYSPLSDHQCEVFSEKSSAQITTAFDRQLGAEYPLPLFPDWDQNRMQNGEYPAIYPNLLMGFQANHIFAMIIHPISPTRSGEEVMIFYVEDGADDPKYEEVRRKNLEAWSEVFGEDIEPCERMQVGRYSPGYHGGAFSPVLDQCSHHFHKWIAKQYELAYQNQVSL